MLERCWSDGIWRRTTLGPARSITTRWIVVITLSPGSGYFHCSSTGCPTRLCTRYISPTPRSSCWNVAIFLESEDHSTTGRSLRIQPALSVA